MAIYTKQDLEKLIFEEIEKMVPNASQIIKEEAVEPEDPTQQYVDWIVTISELAREAIQDIEGGEEPWSWSRKARATTRCWW